MAGFDFKTEVRMKKPKSQITMLMIVGLVLFIVISLVFYLAKSSVKKQSKQSVRQSQEAVLETQPVKELVAKCLDKLAKDAIVLLGKQGGYIYRSQGGTLVDYKGTDEGKFFLNYKDSKIVYGILPPRFATSTYSSEIPDYPWALFPYTALKSGTKAFEGYFGIANMPPLYSSNGPHSIQSQVEEFVDSNIAGCADFRIFEEQGLDIVMSPPNTSVIMGTKGITVKLKIPITITNPATKEFTKLQDFSTKLDIRLNEIYLFANELIKNDISDIKFNISNAKNNRDSFSIALDKHVFSNDDLITITDSKSILSGKPFQYRFARRNRAPALYYIKNTSMEFENERIITKEDLLQGSELEAEDPDEDKTEFTVKALSGNSNLPRKLDLPQLIFRVEVSDGQLADYQNITVDRI